MNTCWKIVLPVVCRTAATAPERPSQRIEPLSVADIASQFRTPPPEYGMMLWWDWDGPVNAAVINRALDAIKADPPDLGWAVAEPSGGLTPKVLAALPPADAMLDQPAPPVKCLHRRCKDANFYMFFNESDQPKARRATLAGSRRVEVWDPTAGAIAVLAGASAGKGTVSVPLHLDPEETRFITLGASAPSM